MIEQPRVVIAGSLFKDSEGYQHYKALNYLGCQVESVSDTPYDHQPGINYQPKLSERIRHKLQLPKDETHLNQRLIDTCRQFKPHIVWVDKAMTLTKRAVKTIKNEIDGVRFLWFSGDDMTARHNQSLYFKQALPLYDYVFTTKSYNCNQDELPAMGAHNVTFVTKAFDPELHYPIAVNENDKQALGADIGFIGTFENDRANKMLHLAQNGLSVRVWGNDWQHWVNKHPNLRVENKPIYGEQFKKSVCATRINLCFLRKLNRDLHTNRSIEIPALGGFMLAERTKEHQRLFAEDQEAVFFDTNDPDELYRKACYYLEHDDERERIAANGRRRCVESGYTVIERVAYMLEAIGLHNNRAIDHENVTST